MSNPTPASLNAELNMYGPDGELQLSKDKEALKRYFVDYINREITFFHDIHEKLNYLIEEGYYSKSVFDQYTRDFTKEAYQYAYSFKFRFKSYMGALKFYEQYALRTFDRKKFLERFEDRVVAVALTLARGDKEFALNLIRDIILQRFQPATPTFMNAGLKDSGDMVSCFELEMTDDLESINSTISSALQLSKRGGGIGVNLSNLRAEGDPIKGVLGQSSSVVYAARHLEQGIKWINQAGKRSGAAVVYLHAHHMDVLTLLDAKKENVDDAIRLKTLSVGITVPDITVELVRKNEDMYLFSPYDVERKYGKPFSYIDITAEYRNLVEDPDIRKKKVNARKFFQEIATVRCEAGYPYLLFIDTVNRAHNPAGTVVMSNLCSEILMHQEPSIINKDGVIEHVGKDVSCNLGSLNIARVMESGDGFGGVVDTAIRALTSVSQQTSIKVVPTVERANRVNRAIGLGAMNYHGFIASNFMEYGGEDALEFTDTFFSTMNYHTLVSSSDLALEIGPFEGFEKSKYADGSAFQQYFDNDYTPKRSKVREVFEKYGVRVPTQYDWALLSEKVKHQGLAHAYRMALAPNGSIGYINNSTSSLHPIPSLIEIRTEAKTGRVYYPAPELTDTNKEYFTDAYEVGTTPLIDTYAVATKHFDQGLSCTLFHKTNSMKDMVKSMLYAHRKGLKTVYYSRMQQEAISGMEVEGCVSCAL